MSKEIRDADRAEVDLTPMLDVVFIMLIFFVVTASFVSERSIGLAGHDNSNRSESTNAAMVLTVNENEEIFYGDRKIEVSAVRALIAQQASTSDNLSVVVRAHEKSTANTYVQIADASRSASVFNIALQPY